MSRAQVTVVLIVYNDESRIAKALESIQRQTLSSIDIVVVDDASTDGTAEIVATAAAIDPRIRVVSRSENSGGCSAPRNDGLALARTPWVMFCDSDDELEIHACANLVAAAEDWDADVVCGTAVRHDVRKGRDQRWRPHLHARDRVIESLADETELLYDTISVNKIFRREFLTRWKIKFPPGLLFEDQVFTLQCYLRANKIGVLQASVYRWNVDRVREEGSITQGRMQHRNVTDRIRINELMDDLLIDASDDIRLAKAIKFLRHEGYLYLSAIGENPNLEDAEAAAAAVRDYLITIDVRAFEHIRPVLRAACYFLFIGDLDALRRAMRWERWASVVDTRIVSNQARQFWATPEGPIVRGREATWWLDVTHLHLLDLPFASRRYFHELQSLQVRGKRVTAQIRTTDFADDLGADVQAQLVWSDRNGHVLASLPLAEGTPMNDAGVRDSGATDTADTKKESMSAVATPRLSISHRVWRGSSVPTVHVRRALMKTDKGSVGVLLTRRGLRNVTALRSIQVPTDRVFVRMPSIAFADRPAGAMFLAGERSSVAWRPGGLARGPAAWGRRLWHAVRRRWLRAETPSDTNPHELATVVDRPIVAYLPAESPAPDRTWPLDLTKWDQAMGDECFLVLRGRIAESVPTRLWGSILDASNMPLGTVVDAATVIITDDPALMGLPREVVVYRPDEGAERYLLPDLPSGVPVVETLPELTAAVRAALVSS